ncbi:thermonuclease family protein [Hypericibacter sp.]|uniref:thermonuclease family protein n=1 Tax=Hypericibacter sp. TaxID=2705401 RepID=UPI003D6CEA6D
MPVSTARIATLAMIGALIVLRAVRMFWPQHGSASKAISQDASLRLSWLTLAAAVLASAAVSHNAPDRNSPASPPELQSGASPNIVASGYPRVINGDTINIHGTRIRLFGIDAPESNQTCKNASGQVFDCGWKATVALVDHIAGGTVSCRSRGVDRFGRTVAVCRLGSEDLNAWMVAQGWAVAYRHHSLDYVPQENAAQAGKLGIWAGSFMLPWEWRRTH